MQRAKNQFKLNINYVRELDSLYHFLKDNQKLANDLSDLLRAEVVYAVSALDKLVHELIRIGMLEVFNGIKPQTKKFKGFTLTAETADRIKASAIERIQNPTRPPLPEEVPEYWFEQEIVLKHKAVTYQDPVKIADGLSLIWDEDHKWQKISVLMGMTDEVVRKTLTNIVASRNTIVHEADINFQTGDRNLLDANDAIYIVDFIDKLGNSIFECVK